MQKNVASQKIGAQMVAAADGSAFTSAVTVYVTGDAGAQGVGSVGAGACTHEGNGYHTYAPAQAETNYDLIAFTFIGTGAIPATVQVETSVDANTTKIAGTAVTAAAGIPEVKVASLAANSITAGVIADAAIDAATYATDTNLYTATCHLTDKNSATATDRYSVKLFKNGAWITSGITVPTIKVVKYADGSELFAATALSAVTGFDGLLKKDITATLASRGEAYEAIIVATVDGSSRTFPATVTRDVSA